MTVNGVSQNDTVNDRPDGDTRPSEDHQPMEDTRVQEYARCKSNLSRRSKDTARTGRSSVHSIASNMLSRFKSVASHRSRPSALERTTSSSSSTSPTSSDDESLDNEHRPSNDPSASHPADIVYGQFGETSEAQIGAQKAGARNEDDKDKRKKKRMKDVSRHTFYVENSQQRLKIVARSEVKLDCPATRCVHRLTHLAEANPTMDLRS